MKKLAFLVTIIAAITLTGCKKTKINTSDITSAPYVIGDYYNDGTIKGIVYEISNSGNNGKLVSLDETKAAFSTASETVGMRNNTDGLANFNNLKDLYGWENTYPAFAWCNAKNGTGATTWYLPAHQELVDLNKVRATVDDGLSAAKGTKFSTGYYWSSTESDEDYAYDVPFNTTGTGSKKTLEQYVRAICVF